MRFRKGVSPVLFSRPGQIYRQPIAVHGFFYGQFGPLFVHREPILDKDDRLAGYKRASWAISSTVSGVTIVAGIPSEDKAKFLARQCCRLFGDDLEKKNLLSNKELVAWAVKIQTNPMYSTLAKEKTSRPRSDISWAWAMTDGLPDKVVILSAADVCSEIEIWLTEETANGFLSALVTAMEKASFRVDPKVKERISEA